MCLRSFERVSRTFESLSSFFEFVHGVEKSLFGFFEFVHGVEKSRFGFVHGFTAAAILPAKPPKAGFAK